MTTSRGLGLLLGALLAATVGGVALAVSSPRRSRTSLQGDEDSDDEPLPDLVSIKKIDKNKLAARAQKVYDEWDASSEDGDDEVGFGGICHLIADEMVVELSEQGADAVPTACSYEQHVFVVGQFVEGVYRVDIPYSTYETGGGYNWKKLPDITFDARDIVLDQISHDPRDFSEYIEQD